MKMRFYYLLTIILVLIQVQIPSIFLPVFPVMFAAFSQDSVQSVLVLAFVSGVICDLVVGSPVGLSAILLVVGAAVIFFLREKFRISLVFALGLAVAAAILFSWIISLL
jgi:cell shape-determining protein MreD